MTWYQRSIMISLFVLPGCAVEGDDSRPHISAGNLLEKTDPVFDRVTQVFTYANGKEYTCSGVLATETTVLTAGHCFSGKDIQKVLILTSVRGGTNEIDVATAITVHPHYNFSAPAKWIGRSNDLALVRLRRGFKRQTTKLPSLWPVDSDFHIEQDAVLKVAGAGDFTESPESAQSAEEVRINMVQGNLRRTYWTHIHYKGRPLFHKVFRAKGESRDNVMRNSCTGDSGGPVFAKDPTTGAHTALVGLVSTGPTFPPYECQKSGWGRYTDLRLYSGWLRCATDFLEGTKILSQSFECQGIRMFWQRNQEKQKGRS